MRKFRIGLIVALAFACALLTRAVSVACPTDVPFHLPATFSGITPCADCPGIRMTLRLDADGVYFLRNEYLERPATWVDMGKWDFDRATSRITLRGGGEAPQFFSVVDAKTIRILAAQTMPIDSKRNDSLVRTDAPFVLSSHTRWRGMYANAGEAGFLTVCLTGRTYPIARAGDDPALEKAYAAARKHSGEPVMVTFNGHLVQRAIVGGQASSEMLVIDTMDRAWPGETCTTTAASTPLRSGEWMVAELNGKKLVAPPEQRPTLTFDADDKRVSGFGGCNRLTGGYEADGNKLKFGPVATTQMACAQGMSTEADFAAALELVTSYKIEGDKLIVYGADGKQLVQFEAKK